MQIQENGSVLLDPAVKAERIALHVLGSVTSDEILREHVHEFIGLGGAKAFDYASMDGETEETKNRRLDFFSQAHDKLELLGIVFRFKEDEDAQDGQEG